VWLRYDSVTEAVALAWSVGDGVATSVSEGSVNDSEALPDSETEPVTLREPEDVNDHVTEEVPLLLAVTLTLAVLDATADTVTEADTLSEEVGVRVALLVVDGVTLALPVSEDDKLGSALALTLVEGDIVVLTLAVADTLCVLLWDRDGPDLDAVSDAVTEALTLADNEVDLVWLAVTDTLPTGEALPDSLTVPFDTDTLLVTDSDCVIESLTEMLRSVVTLALMLLDSE